MIRMVKMLKGRPPTAGPVYQDPAILERQRQASEIAARRATRPRKIEHWAQGLHQMADAGLEGYREGHFTRQQETQQRDAAGLISALMNGKPDKGAFARAAANPLTRDLATRMMQNQRAFARQKELIGTRESAAAERARLADQRQRELIEWRRGLPPTEREKLEMDVLRRRSEAAAKPARPDTNARKYIYSAQDEMPRLAGAEERLTEALNLLEKGIYQGTGAETRSTWNQSMPDIMPNVFSDPDVSKRTQRFQQIMSGEAIAAMSEALKGATTDTEMAEFRRMIADPNLSVEAKRATILGMLRSIQRRRHILSQRAGELGGQMPADPPNIVAPQSGQPSNSDPLGIRK